MMHAPAGLEVRGPAGRASRCSRPCGRPRIRPAVVKSLPNRFIDTTVFGDGLVVDIFSIGHVLAWCGRHAKEADVVHLGSFEG